MKLDHKSFALSSRRRKSERGRSEEEVEEEGRRLPHPQSVNHTRRRQRPHFFRGCSTASAALASVGSVNCAIEIAGTDGLSVGAWRRLIIYEPSGNERPKGSRPFSAFFCQAGLAL